MTTAVTAPERHRAVLPVATYVLRSARRTLLLWAVGVAVVAGVYTASWSAVGGAKASVVDGLPKGLVDALGLGAIGTPAGYLASTVYGILGPALLLGHAVGRGAGLLAGQEEDGTLELELAHPVSRRRVYGERLLAVWLGVVGLVVVLTVVVVAVGTVVGLGVPVAHVVAGSVGLTLLVLCCSTAAYAAGAATGRRALALAAGAGARRRLLRRERAGCGDVHRVVDHPVAVDLVPRRRTARPGSRRAGHGAAAGAAGRGGAGRGAAVRAPRPDGVARRDEVRTSTPCGPGVCCPVGRPSRAACLRAVVGGRRGQKGQRCWNRGARTRSAPSRRPAGTTASSARGRRSSAGYSHR